MGQRERGMHDGDLVRDRQAARDEVLLGDSLQGWKVEGDLAVTDAERAVLAAATGQDGVELLAGGSVHLRPRGRHPRAGYDLADAAVHESLQPARERAGHALQQELALANPFRANSAAA